MSKLSVPVLLIDQIQPHPDADRLDLVGIGGYRAVVGRGQFDVGDLVVYIPTDAVVPQEIAEHFNISTYLAGANKDRVKAVRLRGVLSEGIVVSATLVEDAKAGDDLADALGITKYDPPVPTQMSGASRAWPDFLPHYDIENIKRPEFQGVFQNGEEVVLTEKLHGTNMSIAIGPGLSHDEEAYVCSRGTALKEVAENLYWRAARKSGLIEKVKALKTHLEKETAVDSVSLHGEVLGCQDLKYGASMNDPAFYAFDIMVNGDFVPYDVFSTLCEEIGIRKVPLLARRTFDYHAIGEVAEGKDSLTNIHVREGVVIKPVKERYDPLLGRVVLKYISSSYLSRKGGTEMH